MTDQLETDLRAMLAARAAEVTADAASGEAAVAARLQTGDAALAEVVPLARPQRSRWPIAAAAAVAVVAVLGAAIWAAQDDDTAEVVTDPAPEAPAAIFTGVGSPESVAGSYVFDRLDLPPDQQLTLTSGTAGPDVPADLVAVTWSFDGRPDLPPPTGGVVVLRDLGDGNEWEVVESYSDGASIDEISRTATTITARSTGPAGSYLELSVHRLDGTSISAGGCGGAAVGPSNETVDEGPVACDLVDEPISFADEALTVRLSIVTVDGDALTLEEHLVPPASEASPDATTTTTSSSTATSIEDGTSSSDDPTIGAPGDAAKDVAERVMRDLIHDEAVTMEVADRSDGDVVVTMETISTGTSVFAFVTFDEALGVHRLVGLESGKLQVFDDEGHLSIPAAGRLSISARSTVSDDPQPLITDLLVDHAGTDHGPFELPDDGWLQMVLVADDGQVLHHLSQR